MIENITIRRQTATEGHKLYQLQDSGYYNVTDSVFLGINAEEWAECTLDEAEQFLKHNEELDQQNMPEDMRNNETKPIITE